MIKYTEQFEQFWKLYPGRTNKSGRIIKQDKLGAFREWQKLTDNERKMAMSAHPAQGKYTPDARKWLYHNRWEDEDIGPGAIEKIKLYPIKGRVCGIQSCSMPAVYTNVTKRGHVYYRCAGHLPDEVKKLYD